MKSKSTRPTRHASAPPFQEALVSFAARPDLSPEDRAHLQRWLEDERAGEVWGTVKTAARKHGTPLPVGFFIQEVLSARKVAESVKTRRRYRSYYRKQAAQIKRVAKFLREPPPEGLLPLPGTEKLAERLDEVARLLRMQVEPSWDAPGIVRWTRETQPHMAFASFVANEMRTITGQWLDTQVAVLTEIAFDVGEIDADEVRQARTGRRSPQPRVVNL